MDNVYQGSDADLEEGHLQELKRPVREAARRNACSVRNQNPRRPILLGSMDEIEVGKRGVRIIWS